MPVKLPSFTYNIDTIVALSFHVPADSSVLKIGSAVWPQVGVAKMSTVLNSSAIELKSYKQKCLNTALAVELGLDQKQTSIWADLNQKNENSTHILHHQRPQPRRVDVIGSCER